MTEQQQAKIEKIKAIREKLKNMSEEERAALAERLGIMTIEGHLLSGYNQCFLSYQAANLTVVGGFQQWKKANRTVKKGEHGLILWVPAKPKKESETMQEETDGNNRPDAFFTATVFDISQTEPIEQEQEAFNYGN